MSTAAANTTTARSIAVFAGFATTTKTDGLGNVTKTYYHQGNGSQSGLGEYQDHALKDRQAVSCRAVRRVWRTSTILPQQMGSLCDQRDLLLRQARQHDRPHRMTATATTRTKRVEYIYDNANGNLTQKIEWGEVTGITDGSFTDTGSDKRTTDITYAASSTGWLFAAQARDGQKPERHHASATPSTTTTP